MLNGNLRVAWEVSALVVMRDEGRNERSSGGHRSGWEAVLEINRSDYGVNYGVENGALGDKTTITVAITGMRQ